MKRVGVFVLMAVFFLAVALWSFGSFAEAMKGEGGPEAKEHKGMMGHEWKGPKEMMGPMMMKSMMEKTLVATSDGGVVVLIGNKLIKYDKNLNLVKEVEIKVDMEGMKEHMAEMMKNCPKMRRGMMGDSGQMEPPPLEAPEESVAPQQPAATK